MNRSATTTTTKNNVPTKRLLLFLARKLMCDYCCFLDDELDGDSVRHSKEATKRKFIRCNSNSNSWHNTGCRLSEASCCHYEERNLCVCRSQIAMEFYKLKQTHSWITLNKPSSLMKIEKNPELSHVRFKIYPIAEGMVDAQTGWIYRYDQHWILIESITQIHLKKKSFNIIEINAPLSMPFLRKFPRQNLSTS